MHKILVIEDDIPLANTLKKGLEKKGYQVEVVFDGWQGRIQDWNQFDMIILDWMLPRTSGIELIRIKRQTGWQGICLMLTARAESIDMIAGLEFGADDYLGKPFEWEVLYARITALLRRRVGFVVDELDKITWDKNSSTFFENFESRDLTAIEYKLLCLFFENPNRVFSRNDIIHKIYSEESEYPVSNVIDRHITTIRKKFTYDPIKTVHGAGYKLRIIAPNKKNQE